MGEGIAKAATRLARGRVGHGLILAVLLILVGLGGLAHPLDNALRDARFGALQRPASDSLVIVEIDAASLQALDTWPWPRTHYAELIDRLRAAGAEIVAFDVDFSSQSSVAADSALQRAIEAASGSIIVPAFLQQRRNGDTALHETAPQAAISGDAIIANVNLFPEADGRVRRGVYEMQSESGDRPSLAAALAGATGRNDFHIDFGIRAESIPRLSFAHVRSGEFDPALIRGRRVLVGATALELGDELAVPVHGIMPGVVVHALSYESILQGRTLWLLSPLAGLSLALTLLATRLRRPRQALSGRSFAPSLIIVAVAIVAPYAVQALMPISLNLAIVLIGEAVWVFYLLLSEMQRRADALVEQREALLRHQAQHDPDTALPNQRALSEHIEALVAASAGKRVCVIVAGIDRLPSIRTALGHQGANDVIRSLAMRVDEIAAGALPSRLESSLVGFAKAFENDADVAAWGEYVLKVLGDTALVAGVNIDVSFKLGVAVRGDGQTAGALIEQACAALNSGRRRRNRVTLYEDAHTAEPLNRLSLMTDLLAGMDHGELTVVYQPKQGLNDGAIVGAEALLRWRHLERGQVSPDLFVAAAEETGHIRKLTQWTVNRIVHDARMFAPATGISLSFNLSAALLCNDDAIDELLKTVVRSQLPLVAEITETSRIEDAAHAERSLARLRAAGVLLSIDDYGMGLSSLSYLRLIDAHELKLDKSFVSALMMSERDRVLIKSTIDLAHALGMKIAAEGVETETVREMLRLMGCDSIQGYLFARPMSATALLGQLKRERAPAAARVRLA